MGGRNLLAFFDFPEKGPERTVRGVGSMHHVALKAHPEQFCAILAALHERQIPYSLHGSPELGSLYVRDPADVLVEVTTGYWARKRIGRAARSMANCVESLTNRPLVEGR